MTLIDIHTHQPTAEGVVSPRSFGIHPWHVDDEPSRSFAEFRERYIAEFAQAEIIGECGLDKVCRSAFDRQTELFGWHVAIAAELGKPMVVHCVHAYQEVMAMRRLIIHHVEEPKHAVAHPWILHGFTGSPQMARDLCRVGIIVSFGAAILDPLRPRVAQTLAGLDIPFFLETDMDPRGIAYIYDVATSLRGTTVECLANTIKETYSSLFKL